MGYRISRVYTRTGDDGGTGLADGSRRSKADARIAVMGDVDELNSVIGLVRAGPLPAPVDTSLARVQNELFEAGAMLSNPGSRRVDEGMVARLESEIDGFNEGLPPLKEFILPGGGTAAAACHLARAVCRRAERAVVALIERGESVDGDLLRYLNRLSDLLFVLARVLAREGGDGEVYWRPRRDPGQV